MHECDIVAVSFTITSFVVRNGCLESVPLYRFSHPKVEHHYSRKWDVFHVRVSGYDVYAPVCFVCLHTLLDQYCDYCQYEEYRKQKRVGRKLNLRKEEDMRSTVREVKDGHQLKLRVAARAYTT